MWEILVDAPLPFSLFTSHCLPLHTHPPFSLLSPSSSLPFLALFNFLFSILERTNSVEPAPRG